MTSKDCLDKLTRLEESYSVRIAEFIQEVHNIPIIVNKEKDRAFSKDDKIYFKDLIPLLRKLRL